MVIFVSVEHQARDAGRAQSAFHAGHRLKRVVHGENKRRVGRLASAADSVPQRFDAPRREGGVVRAAPADVLVVGAPALSDPPDGHGIRWA